MACLLLVSCVQPAAPPTGESHEPTLPPPLPAVQHPADNPASAMKAALGCELFFDPRLSRNNKVSCAACRHPGRAFRNDGRFATGVDGKPGTRNVPALINLGHAHLLYFDGRAATLGQQMGVGYVGVKGEIP
jgi:cytochrome c peroxidase